MRKNHALDVVLKLKMTGLSIFESKLMENGEAIQFVLDVGTRKIPTEFRTDVIEMRTMMNNSEVYRKNFKNNDSK